MKLQATSCVPIYAKGYWFDTHFWNKSFVQFPFKNYNTLKKVLIFGNVKTLIMLMLFLLGPCGRPTWSLRATWCPRAPRWWPCSRECCGGNNHRRTRNISPSTAISNSFAGYTPKWDQARSEMQLLHPGLGRHLGRFPVGLTSRACLTSLPLGILDTWPN